MQLEDLIAVELKSNILNIGQILLIPKKEGSVSQVQYTVKKGDTLVTFDIDAIKAAGYDVITPVIITNSNNYVDVIETEQKEVNALDCLLKVFK